MQKPPVALAALLSLAAIAGAASTVDAGASLAADTDCSARSTLVNDVALHWFSAAQEDAAELASWCRGVGIPVIASTPAEPRSNPPALEDLVVVSWNAHLADGKLVNLISDLRTGKLTGGRPVQHFVLLLQELYRRGHDVPAFAPNARAAYAILPRDPRAPDAGDYAQQLGLAMAYVPSMRNGAEMMEDRGNAIISTEPLSELFALELPFERQRRVAAGAAVIVKTPNGFDRLQLVDMHLEPLASPSSLWVLRNPRRRQVGALLDLLQQPRFTGDGVGTLIGGDFNTVQGGAREEAYRKIRAWSHSLSTEDPRATHLLGRLDYIFARLAPAWQVSTVRAANKYGSDHYPVVGRFHPALSTP